MTFGEKLQSLRQRAGMSQDALAERLQVSRQAVSRWERDETMPETDKVVALADIFGVTTDYLLRLQLEQTKPEEKPPPGPEKPPKPPKPPPGPRPLPGGGGGGGRCQRRRYQAEPGACQNRMGRKTTGGLTTPKYRLR